ncbi:MAG: hypothetical protein ACE5JB_13490 [bacterium]
MSMNIIKKSNGGGEHIELKYLVLVEILLLTVMKYTLREVFDVFLVATLKDNDIEGPNNVNVDDFKEFTFLKVENPID